MSDLMDRWLGILTLANTPADEPQRPHLFMSLPDLTARTVGQMKARLGEIGAPIACVSNVVLGSIAVQCWPVHGLQPQADFEAFFADQADHLLSGIAVGAKTQPRFLVPTVTEHGVVEMQAISTSELRTLLNSIIVLDASPSLREVTGEPNVYALQYTRSNTRLKGWILK